MRFLVGGFHAQLQVVTYRDGHSGLSVLESDDLPKCNAMTWITAASDANHFYGLQALPDEDGRVHFVRLDGGRVHVLDSLSTFGRDPCHCCLRDGALMITNYSSGNVVRVQLRTDGSFDPSSVTNTHFQGSGPVQGRQEAAHPHAALFDSTRNRFIVTDLGSDKLRFIERNGESSSSVCNAGDGPRHLVAHSNGRYAYIINELSNTVSTYRLNAEGASCVHSTSALPEGVSGEGMCAAAILISPDDRFLYISHRLEHHPEGDALVWLEILEEGARVTRRGHIRTGQDNLRGAAISRDGRFVITGSRKGKGAVLYERDEDGSLRLVARNEHVVMPSCFVEL